MHSSVYFARGRNSHIANFFNQEKRKNKKPSQPHTFLVPAGMSIEPRTCELQANTVNQEEVYTALKVLLDQREADRKEHEEAIVKNLKRLIAPYIEKSRRLGFKQIRAHASLFSNRTRRPLNPDSSGSSPCITWGLLEQKSRWLS